MKKFFFLLFGVVLLLPHVTFASDFPWNAATLYFDSSTTQKTFTIMPAALRTILEVTVTSGTVGNRVEVHCNGSEREIVDTYGAAWVSIPMQYVCDEYIEIVKTGNGGIAVNLTYIEGFVSSSSPVYLTGSATTTEITEIDNFANVMLDMAVIFTVIGGIVFMLFYKS